jgi:uncharacterized membrane protein YjgN (DUF898 family)
MQWFYASNGQQKGPVSDEEFEKLVREGVIRSDTLVWRAGMPAWVPHWQLGTGSAGLPPLPTPPSIAPVSGPAPATAAASVNTPNQPVQLDFSGQAGEFFQIWIVNILLTIVTFGIYAAWARVRTRRYIYSNTQLLGHAFEYLADPKKILIGNLIVMGVFLLYTLAGVISPFVKLAVMPLLLVAIPWFIVRALVFNARNSAWRGLKFYFHGRYRQAAVVFVLLPLAVPFTLGLLLPYVVKRQKEFLMGKHTYGGTEFSFHGDAGELYKIYGIALLFFLPLIMLYFVIIGMAVAATIHSGGRAPAPNLGLSAMIGLGALVAFPMALVGSFYLRSRIFNFTWNNTMLGDNRFEAWMRARDLLWLQLSNSFMIAVTLGLMYPWAAMRTVRFRLSCMQFVPTGNMDNFVAGSQVNVGALGESAADFLDIDLGFGV